jgi:hypothetical protein
MKTLERTDTLEPNRFAKSIQQDPEFIGELPAKPLSELAPEQRRVHLQRAIASGAFSIADRLEQERGEDYDLNANLYRLVGTLNTFDKSSAKVNQLRERYSSPEHMPPAIRQNFYHNKAQVIEFNHILSDIINAGATKFNFDELLAFMVNMHAASGEQENTAEFYTQAKNALTGMRNELAFEQVLMASGLDYELGNAEDDARGGDFIVEGVPIDVKSSEAAAEQAKKTARRGGYDDSGIIWSRLSSKDFNGELTLPYEMSKVILARIQPDLDRALKS